LLIIIKSILPRFLSGWFFTNFAAGFDFYSTEKMRKNLLIAGTVVLITILALIVFNKITSRARDSLQFAQVKQGKFEVSVVGTGELIAERSVDILAPEVMAGGRGVEAEITLKNSKYESPEIIRQAEIAFDKAKRGLEQMDRSYKLKTA
jgi:hypothetical protein